MEHRLQQFLSAENISQSQLAEKMGVARASVSHILAGRNRPGYDFIENISRLYPSLSLEWLILGRGKMYKEASFHNTQLFDPPQEESPAAFNPVPAPVVQEPQTEQKPVCNTAEKHIEKIIAFFSDGTFQELK